MVLALALGVSAFAIGISGATPSQELTGTVAEWHGDDLVHHRLVSHDVMLDTGTRLVKVEIDDPRAFGQKLRLRGNYIDTAHGRVFWPTSADPVPAAARSVVTAGTHKAAVLLLNFTNDRSQPWTAAQAHGVMVDNSDSVDQYYREASNGQIGFSADVFGWYAINLDNSGCNVTGWRNAANSAAAAAGVNLANYQHVVYVWPQASSCGWTGMANMPGNQAFINGSMMSGTFAHELGHNLGMDHAQSLSCTSGTTRVALSDTCTTSEYGDPFDNMGSGYNALPSDWHLAELGWLPNAQTITASGTYALAPVGNMSASPRMLRIARPDGTYLNLEFRQPKPPFENYTSTYPVTNGVTLRLAPDAYSSTIAPTKLIDTTPATTSYWDSPLAVGQTFSDNTGTAASNVSIKTLSVSATGASVQVTFPLGGTSTSSTTTTTQPPTTTTTIAPTTTTTTPTTTTSPTTTTTTTTSPPSGALGPASFVKVVGATSRGKSGNNAMTLTVPANGGVAAGHRIVAAAAIGPYRGTVTCSDSRGNVYSIDGRASANNLFVCSGYVSTPLQPGDTITLTYPSYSGQSQASIFDFAGIAPVTPGNGAAIGASSSSTTVSVNPALVTSNANDVLFAAAGANGTFAGAYGFTALQPNAGLGAAYRIVTSTGSFAPFGTVGGGAWRSVLVAYRVG
jgi:hypothetical protein